MKLKDYIYRKREFSELLSAPIPMAFRGEFESAVFRIYDHATTVISTREPDIWLCPVISLAQAFCAAQPTRIVTGYAVAAEVILSTLRPRDGEIVASEDIIACAETMQGADVMLHCAALLSENFRPGGSFRTY